MKSSKARGSRTDKHDKEVKEMNINFTSKLREKAVADCYEESSPSSEGDSKRSNVFTRLSNSCRSKKSNTRVSVSSRRNRKQRMGAPKKRQSNSGKLITLNLDMGKRGFYILHGLHNQDPFDIA